MRLMLCALMAFSTRSSIDVWLPDAKTVSTFATIACMVQAKCSGTPVLGKHYAVHDPMVCRMS
jgi:hypothetical protein